MTAIRKPRSTRAEVEQSIKAIHAKLKTKPFTAHELARVTEFSVSFVRLRLDEMHANGLIRCETRNLPAGGIVKTWAAASYQAPAPVRVIRRDFLVAALFGQAGSHP